jgi:hypothetical protein
VAGAPNWKAGARSPGFPQVFDGICNRIGVALAPAVEWLANVFVSLASDGVES